MSVPAAYDSRPETRLHIDRVRTFVMVAIGNLADRAIKHDASKLEQPELEAFDVYTPRLAQLEFGSEAYKQSIADLGPALDHHYAENDHHPEHFENGVNGMSLMGLIEMVCDWRAASERTGQRTDDPEKVGTFNPEWNFERFGIEPQLAQVIRNTIVELGL